MKAILMTAAGGPEVLSLRDIDEPQIASPTDIRVKLHAAGVNPIDTKVRRRGVFFPNPLPAVLGCDGAGEVVAVGAAVDRFKPGDKVWFCHGGLGREQGNYADYTVVDQRWASSMPTALSFAEAAASPLVLITAWGALFDRGGLQAGQTVLIHAGAGGVGHIAIQLAKLKGARVITTVSSEQKAEFVKTLGADEVIDYRIKSFADSVNKLTDGKGCDLVFDTVGPSVFEQSIPVTAHFGRLVTILDPGELNWAEARMRNLLIGFELMLTPMLRDLHEARDKHVAILDQCAAWFDQGRLRVHVGEQLPLADASIAHEKIEEGHTQGKIVLTI
ncbi:zinc-dependent alcohol dehydrogenase family protein [Methylomicrobium sp. Wu6]|uniref:zinc-dependent alcohol dehydrogenase family protein n=1 Tax=Methylomicrobium sp. Wu6 TaxID=3107928 RepID=UPI002DD626B7|nr:zinc-dependent alcohol dehydrogenase family protein [Methylomicrobium sp. Wu6]MEC4750611.1 zinc-dependent alcohol dehydrogenase family protein [Methylomicrobium sp. Wu6]